MRFAGSAPRKRGCHRAEYKVVAEPGGKRNVPAPPEFPDGLRGVGKIKIFEEGKAEHFSEADRHVGIAGKIEINLQRVANDAKPRRGQRKFRRRQGENLVRRKRHGIGDDHFLARPPAEPPDPLSKHRAAELAAQQLRGDGVPAQDRPGHQLRKKENVERHIRGILCRRPFAPVNINHIRERVKREKRDSDGHKIFGA